MLHFPFYTNDSTPNYKRKMAESGEFISAVARCMRDELKKLSSYTKSFSHDELKSKHPLQTDIDRLIQPLLIIRRYVSEGKMNLIREFQLREAQNALKTMDATLKVRMKEIELSNEKNEKKKEAEEKEVQRKNQATEAEKKQQLQIKAQKLEKTEDQKKGDAEARKNQAEALEQRRLAQIEEAKPEAQFARKQLAQQGQYQQAGMQQGYLPPHQRPFQQFAGPFRPNPDRL
ncbi:hypothetical protein B0J14DRAFT_576462, partial [Halenospora varia]